MPGRKTTVPRADLSALFSQALKVALLKKFRKNVTAAFLVKSFNAKCNQGEGISYESGRNWLNGNTLPVFEKIVILRDWLVIDLNVIGLFVAEKIYPIPMSDDLFPTAPNFEKIKSHQLDELNKLSIQFQNTIDDLKKQYE
jgi:hypothetical protein